MTQNPDPPAGWYPQGDQERWWNGSSWSDNFRPLGTDSSGGYPTMFQAGQQAYPQAAYGQPAYVPPPKSHTGRNLLIAFGVLFLLVVGGCTIAVAVVAKSVDDVVNDDTPGGPNNPLTITEGEAFEVAGFEYQPGWRVDADELGDADVVGLQVRNSRDSADYAFVTVKLLDGNVVVAQISCTGAGDRIAPDTTETLDCSSSDPVPASYDEITIQDAF